MKYFDGTVSYPDPLTEGLVPGVCYEYVASDYVAVMLNYAKPVSAFVLDRYRRWMPEDDDYTSWQVKYRNENNEWVTESFLSKEEAYAALAKPRVMLGSDFEHAYGDDVVILSKTKSNSWLMTWFDCDSSDCVISLFSTDEPDSAVLAEFERWIMAHPVSANYGGTGKHRPIPVAGLTNAWHSRNPHVTGAKKSCNPLAEGLQEIAKNDSLTIDAAREIARKTLELGVSEETHTGLTGFGATVDTMLEAVFTYCNGNGNIADSVFMAEHARRCQIALGEYGDTLPEGALTCLQFNLAQDLLRRGCLVRREAWKPGLLMGQLHHRKGDTYSFLMRTQSGRLEFWPQNLTPEDLLAEDWFCSDRCFDKQPLEALLNAAHS